MPVSAAKVGTESNGSLRHEKKLADSNQKLSLLDENTEALTNSSDEDLQEYADKLLSPVDLCDDDGNDVRVHNHNNSVAMLRRDSSFDTSFIFNEDDDFSSNIDELIISSTNSDLANALDLQLSESEADGNNDDNNDEGIDLLTFCDNDRKSKKRKIIQGNSRNKAAMLFGMFFMCAFFGSYISSVVPSSKRSLIQLPVSASAGLDATQTLSLFGRGKSRKRYISSRRRRRLLSADDMPVNHSDTAGKSAKSLSATNGDVNLVDDKAIALWQNILHDMKSSPPVKYPVVATSDVKQLLLKIGNFSHSYKISKIKHVGDNTASLVNRKQALRARSRTSSTTRSNHTLVPYHKSNGTVDLNTVFTQEISTNASFMLCPKPYGTLAHADSQSAHPPSAFNNNNNNFEHIPDTFMYDDIKVNRDLVLLMPSTSLGGKRGLGTNQQWDGKWVQVDAVVRSVRPAASLSGLKAIAGSQ
jgi:hypothetical protein